MKRLGGRVTLVTGAVQGIGAGISRVLARHGAHVVLTDVQEAVHETAQEITGEGLKAESRIMDVTDSDQVETVIEDVLGSHGKIDVLVNNAGIYPRRKLVDMSEEFMTKMFDINVFGMFRCARAVLPGMMERKQGKIINMSSVTGPYVGTPEGGQTAYASTKSAVQGFTVALALEVAQYGINVNCVMPGYVESRSAWGLRGTRVDEEAEERMREFGRKIPWGRQGTPEEIGNLVLFLASDESRYITGSSIVIDGGNILQEEYLGPYHPK